MFVIGYLLPIIPAEAAQPVPGVNQGATGTTTFPVGGVIYGNGVSHLQASSLLNFDGTNLIAPNIKTGAATTSLRDIIYRTTPAAIQATSQLASWYGLDFKNADSATTSMNGAGLMHGTLVVDNYVFASRGQLGGSAPIDIMRFPVDNIKDFSSSTISNTGGNDCYNGMEQLAYVQSQDEVYGICSDNNVWRIDPHTMVLTKVINQGTGGTVPNNAFPSMATDGAYLYLVSSPVANSDSVVSKFDATTYAFIASSTIGNVVGANDSLVHNIAFDGVNLYATGGQQNTGGMWIARIDPSTLISNVQYLSSRGWGPTDDMAITPDYIYLGMESSAITVQVSKANLANFTYIPLNHTIYALYFDGRYVWAGSSDAFLIFRIDPTTSSFTTYTEDPNPPAGGTANEIIGDGGRIFYTHWTIPSTLNEFDGWTLGSTTVTYYGDDEGYVTAGFSVNTPGIGANATSSTYTIKGGSPFFLNQIANPVSSNLIAGTNIVIQGGGDLSPNTIIGAANNATGGSVSILGGNGIIGKSGTQQSGAGTTTIQGGKGGHASNTSNIYTIATKGGSLYAGGGNGGDTGLGTTTPGDGAEAHFFGGDAGTVNNGTTTAANGGNVYLNGGWPVNGGVQGSIVMASSTNVTGTASTTIIMEKLQFQGYDSTGTKRCIFITGAGAWAILSGACNP